MVTGLGLQGANWRNTTITKMQTQRIGPSLRSRREFQHFGIYDMLRKLRKLGKKTTMSTETQHKLLKKGQKHWQQRDLTSNRTSTVYTRSWDTINHPKPQVTAL